MGLIFTHTEDRDDVVRSGDTAGSEPIWFLDSSMSMPSSSALHRRMLFEIEGPCDAEQHM